MNDRLEMCIYSDTLYVPLVFSIYYNKYLYFFYNTYR